MSGSVGLGANVGTAWVGLRFSARGAATQIRRELEGETAGLGATLGDSTGRRFQGAFGKRMHGLGAQLKSALAPLSIYGAAGLAAMGVESARMATTFQASMTKVRTQAGASQREVDKMSAAILRLGKYAEQSPQQLADATYHLESLGLRGSKALSALRTASDLAAVSGANLEETTNAIGGAWRTGIKGAANFTQAAATLNAVVGAGNMRMSDLLAALGTGILPAAKTFGLNLKQVGAALALFTDEGVPAQDAATRLRMSFSLLGAPSVMAEKQLKTIGLSGLKLANAMRGPQGLVGAISLLKSHLDASGLSASKQAALLSRAFGGGRSSSAILSMINNLDVLRKKQDQVNSSTGKYGAAVAAQRKTAQAQFALLKSSLDILMVKLGGVLLPPAVGFVKFINNTALPAAGKLVRAFRHIIPVDSIRRDWQALMRLFGAGQPRVSLPTAAQVNAATGATPAPSLLGPGPGKGLAPLTRRGPAGAVRLNTSGLGKQLGASLGGALGKAAMNLASRFGGLIVKALSGLDWVNLGKSVGGNVIGFAIGFISNLGADLFSASFWKKHWLDLIMAAISLVGIGKIGGLIAKILGHIPILRMFAPFFRGLEKVADPIWKAGGKLLKSLGKGILDGIKTVLPKSGESIAHWLELLPTRLGVAYLNMLKFGLKLLKGLGKGILSGVEWIGRVIGKVIGWLLKPWVRAGSWLLRTGGNLILGLLRGIRAKMVGIGSWIWGNVVSPIINWVKHHFGIHSPSRVMHGIGVNLIAGLVRGIITSDPINPIKRIFGGIPSALGSFVDKGLLSIASLPRRAMKLLSGLGGFFSSLFGGGHVSGNVTSWLMQALKITGTPKSWLGGLQRLVGKESGGNPTARNPITVLGQHATGLLQMLPSTFGAYRLFGSITNPIANAVASIRYIKARYGSVFSIPGLFGGNYQGYDSGGVARGLGYLPKYTPKPERVLSPAQTTAFERLVDVLDGKSGGSHPVQPKRQRVEFDPRSMEMWIRDLATQEANAEIGFRKR